MPGKRRLDDAGEAPAKRRKTAREHMEPSPGAVVLAGTLREAIVGHTKERIRHFFLFLYTFRILMHVLKLPAGDWAGLVAVAATHQVDAGLRRDEGWDQVFAKTDGSMLDLPATAFRKVDAAHYCNLGLAPRLAGLCSASEDVRAEPLLNALKLICGNTRLMPQRINIGPDRVIDKLHGDLCMAYLKQMGQGAAAISPAFFDGYRAAALERLEEYAKGQAEAGNAAVAAAARLYAAVLAETDAPQELRQAGTASRMVNLRPAHCDEVWTTLAGNASADFFALGLREDPEASLGMLWTRRVH
ncbi:hypothetical protein [Mangrovicoccus sp. HB161399]|uniref:hypothetical protein n=1 Tax=Mangrovicoccus sp. HB161399 TaxID=2720392 RepID=UPI001555E578|nr:hypothetical protein [Mangrovicoccus sp. HB161399]